MTTDIYICSLVVILSILQGVTLPKAQPKFENFLKNGHKVTDTKVQYKFTVIASIYHTPIVLIDQETLCFFSVHWP